jgi:hypothetical protein
MKCGSREIGNGEGISIIASKHVRHRYKIFQIVRLVAVVTKPVDERKKVGGRKTWARPVLAGASPP